MTPEEVRAYYDAHPEFPRPDFLGPQTPPPCAPQPASARRRAPRDETPEAEVEAGITALLREDGWRGLKTDPVSDKGRGKGFGELGMADYLYIRYETILGCGCCVQNLPQTVFDVGADVLWIEHKRPRGGRISKAQRDWHKLERERGAVTLIAGVDFKPTVTGFREWYEKSGLLRRKI